MSRGLAKRRRGRLLKGMCMPLPQIKIMSYRKKTKDAANREIDVLPTPLQDTDEFKAYVEQVQQLVLKTKCGVTQSEMNRILKPPTVDWTVCALEQLFDVIEEKQVGVFTKYFPRILRQTPNLTEQNYHAGMFNRPAKKDWPHIESVYGEL